MIDPTTPLQHSHKHHPLRAPSALHGLCKPSQIDKLQGTRLATS